MAEIIMVDFKNTSEQHFDGMPVSDNFRRGFAMAAALYLSPLSDSLIEHTVNNLLDRGFINLQEACYTLENFGLEVM